MKQLVKSYRAAVNPPYKKGDTVYLLLTFFLIAVLIILVLFLQKPQDDRGRAEVGHNNSQSIIGNPVKSVTSDKISIVTASAPLTEKSIMSVQLDPTLVPVQVAYFKEADKKPFAIVYEAPFEVTLGGLKSGSHRVSAQAIDSDGNIFVSVPVDITTH